MKTDEVNKAFTEFGERVIERAKANLKKGGKYGTHNTSNSLSNSLSFQLKTSDRSIAFDFYESIGFVEEKFRAKAQSSLERVQNFKGQLIIVVGGLSVEKTVSF